MVQLILRNKQNFFTWPLILKIENFDWNFYELCSQIPSYQSKLISRAFLNLVIVPILLTVHNPPPPLPSWLFHSNLLGAPLDCDCSAAGSRSTCLHIPNEELFLDSFWLDRSCVMNRCFDSLQRAYRLFLCTLFSERGRLYTLVAILAVPLSLRPSANWQLHRTYG